MKKRIFKSNKLFGEYDSQLNCFKNDKGYYIYFKVNGDDIYSYDEFRMSKRVNDYYRFIQRVPRFSIIQAPFPVNSKTFNVFDKKYQNQSSETLYEFLELSKMKANYVLEQMEIHQSFMYFDSLTEKELKQVRDSVSALFSEAKTILNSHELSKIEIQDFQTRIMNFNTITKKHQSLVPFGGLIEYYDYLKHNKSYSRVLVLENYNQMVHVNWLSIVYLIASKFNCLVKTTFNECELTEKELNTVINHSKDEVLDRSENENKFTSFLKNEKRQAEVNFVAQSYDEKYKPMKIQVVFHLFESSLIELEEKAEELKQQIRIDADSELYTFYGRQEDFYYNLFNNDVIYNQDIMSNTVALSYPFDNNTLIDKDGYLLGFNDRQEPFIFNLFMKNEFRTSFNYSMQGLLGMGKTLLAKTLMYMSLISHNLACVIDVENEYTVMCERVGGTIYSLDDENNATNPLMCIQLSDKEDFGSNYQLNETRMIAFFSLLLEVKPFEKEVLKKALRNLFESKGFYKMKKFNGVAMPTLCDLQAFLKEVCDEYKNSNEDFTRLLLAFENLVDERGMGKYFNKQGIQFDIDKSKMIVLDVHSIMKSSDTKMVNAMIFNMINSIYAHLVSLGKKHNKQMVYTMFHLSEFSKIMHLDLDVLRYFESMSKQARKYLIALGYDEQNFNRFKFVGNDEKSILLKSIFDNITTQFVFNNDTETETLVSLLDVNEGYVHEIKQLQRFECIVKTGVQTVKVNLNFTDKDFELTRRFEDSSIKN